MLRTRDPSSLDPGTAFADLGLDSLMSVEFRGQLQKSTGLLLPATLSYDHPSPRHVSAFVLGLLEQEFDEAPSAELSNGEVRQLLGKVSIDKLRASGLLERVLALIEPGEPGEPVVEAEGEEAELDEVDLAHLLDTADLVLGGL